MSAAILISHAKASSHPPPNANPFTAAIVGLLQFSTVKVKRCPAFAYVSDSIGVMVDMYAMSAPAENALSPSPVSMITLMVSSLSISLKTVISSLATSVFIALYLSGRFIFTVATPSDFETLTSDMKKLQSTGN